MIDYFPITTCTQVFNSLHVPELSQPDDDMTSPNHVHNQIPYALMLMLLHVVILLLYDKTMIHYKAKGLWTSHHHDYMLKIPFQIFSHVVPFSPQNKLGAI